MILIAESGATKTDWCSVSKDGTLRRIRTKGLSPITLSYEGMKEIASVAVPSVNPSGESVAEIFFYGAGFVSESLTAPLREILGMWCPFARVHFESDLTAAARALFGNGTGVVAIIGTGSNSCLWEDGSIVRNIRPGGFILGDEGGGVSLGKRILSDYIKGLLPESLAESFDSKYGLDYASIVAHVYKGEETQRFLASFAEFAVEYLEDEYIKGIVHDNLCSLFERSLSRYGCRRVGIVGSLGFALKDQILAVAEEYGLEVVRFVKAPMDELVKFHFPDSDRLIQ